MQPNAIQYERMTATLSLQFPGCDIARLLDHIEVVISRKTGRIRAITDSITKEQLFSLRTSDGRFLPTYAGGLRLLVCGYSSGCLVMNEEAAPFIASGKSAFCKHVVRADCDIVPESEVLLLDTLGNLLGVGTAKQPGYIIDLFQSGLAAKVKHCRD